MSSRDVNYRPHQVLPGTPMELRIHGRDGSKLRVKGMLDQVPNSAANTALVLVIVDAVAEPITS